MGLGKGLIEAEESPRTMKGGIEAEQTITGLGRGSVVRGERRCAGWFIGLRDDIL